jgi:PKD repeat protein
MTWPGSSQFVVALLLSISASAQLPPAAVASQPVKPAQKAEIFKPPQTPTSPVLKLSADPLSTQPNQNIHFKATWNTTVYRVVYHFDWGDNQSTDRKSPEADHSYGSAGAYTVRVTARSASAALASQTPGISSNDLLINISQPLSGDPKRKPKRPTLSLPVLTLNTDLQAPSPNQTVHFTTSWDRQPYVEKYSFDWGDGHTSDEKGPDAYHAYSIPGPYTVRAVANILSNDETVGVRSNDITVTVALPRPPVQTVAMLTADRPKARVGEPVTFTASVDPPSPAVRYRFAFGDGAEQDSSSNRIVHTYDRAGDLHATVTASINGGDESVTSPPLELAVGSPEVLPRLSVIPVSRDLFAGEDVILQASLDPSPKAAQYAFNWGDDSPRDVVDVGGRATHRYTKKGTYTVEVTASSEGIQRVHLEKSVILIVGTRPLPWWLLVLAAAGALALAARLIRRRPDKHRPRPRLQVDGFSDAGDHHIARIDRSVPPLSLMLKPGMDSAEHDVIFPKNAAASD